MWITPSAGQGSSANSIGCFAMRTSAPSGTMIERVFELHRSLDRNGVLMGFTGGFTPALITTLLTLVERKMGAIEADPRLRKRVFNVVLEGLQNLYHHPRTDAGAHVPQDPSDNDGVILLARSNSGYAVATGNMIGTERVAVLKAHLDRVNGCDPTELRELYQRTLSDGRYGPSGGGGLGLIDMARKSGGKLEYGFVPLDKGRTFFGLNVNVNA